MLALRTMRLFAAKMSPYSVFTMAHMGFTNGLKFLKWQPNF